MIRLPQITGSKLHRAWKCPASRLLPQNVNQAREDATEPARGRGKVVHRYLERVRAAGMAQALAEVPPDLVLLCKALDIDKLPTHLATEVAYAYNWRDRTARELGRNLDHRDYALLGVDFESEIPLTVDISGWAMLWVPGPVQPDGTTSQVQVRRAYSGDYKTGHTHYPRPKSFAQTLLGSLCAALTMGCDDAFAELIYIHDDGDSHAVRDLVDEWDLVAFQDELEALGGSWEELEGVYAKLGGGGLAKAEGPQCDYCPGFKDCSAKVALVRELPAELLRLGVRTETTGELALVRPPQTGKAPEPLELDLAPGAVTVRNAAAAWEACERIERICKRVREEVAGIAYYEPVQLADGRVISRFSRETRSMDGRIAAAVLEERYGREEAMKAVDITVTFAALRERVVANIDMNEKPRPKIETRNKDGVYDKVLAEVEKRGGISTNVTESCKPRQPRRLKSGK